MAAPPPYSASGVVSLSTSEAAPVPIVPHCGLAASSGTSTGPSHDYSAHQQSSWRVSTLAAVRSSPSARSPSPAVDPSSTTYFESRPPPDGISDETLSYVLFIAPHAQPDTLAYPEPKKLWLARDLTELDWATFLNYLFPLQRDAPPPKADAGPALRGAGSHSANVPIVKKLVHPTAMDRKTEHGMNEAPSSPDAAIPIESERQRRERIGQIAAHWNQAFFGPRRLHVDVDVLSYSSELLAPDTPNDAATFSQGPSGPEPELIPRHEAALHIYTPRTSVLAPSVNGAFIPQTANGSVGPSGAWYASQPQSPSSTLPRPSVSGTTLTPRDSMRAIAGLPDDREEGDLQELRGAFAKVVLSPRFREETAAVLQEFNRELQARQQEVAKQLKGDAKRTQEEIKVMAKQYKLERRAEKKRLKTAEKLHKTELKALKNSRKDLEKRQKEARKEAKALKANANKAGKKKSDDPTPYKG